MGRRALGVMAPGAVGLRGRGAWAALRLRGAAGRVQERVRQRLLAVGERVQWPCWRLQTVGGSPLWGGGPSGLPTAALSAPTGPPNRLAPPRNCLPATLPIAGGRVAPALGNPFEPFWPWHCPTTSGRILLATFGGRASRGNMRNAPGAHRTRHPQMAPYPHAATSELWVPGKLLGYLPPNCAPNFDCDIPILARANSMPLCLETVSCPSCGNVLG